MIKLKFENENKNHMSWSTAILISLSISVVTHIMGCIGEYYMGWDNRFKKREDKKLEMDDIFDPLALAFAYIPILNLIAFFSNATLMMEIILKRPTFSNVSNLIENKLEEIEGEDKMEATSGIKFIGDIKGKMRLIFKYTSAGVELDKIRMSNKTALTLWSLSRETIVGENGKPSPYIKGDELRQVNFHVRTELSKGEVDKINNSKGIIISSEQRDDFRYGYIPEN